MILDVVTGQDSTISKHGGNRESNAAWKKARRSSVDWCQRIVELLAYAELRGVTEGLTPKEIARHFGKQLHQISGRFSDLENLGKIYKTKHVRLGSRAVRLVK